MRRMPPGTHYSAPAIRQTRSSQSENMCCWSQVTDSAALSLWLLLGRKGERTGLVTTLAPRVPVSSSYQLVSRNFHTVIPASPSSPQQIPHVYNLNLKAISFLLWKPVWREESLAFSNKLCVCPVLCLLLTQPAHLQRATSFSAWPTHTRAASQLLVCEKTI